MTPKQVRFVAGILSGKKQSDAYKEAGYKGQGHTAEVNANRLMKNADVAAAVKAGQEKAADAAVCSAAQILRELAVVGFSDIGQMMDLSGPTPRLLPLNQIPESARRAISSIKVHRTVDKLGEASQEAEIVEIKLWPKVPGLEKLGQARGMFKDKEITPSGPAFKIYIGFSPDEV